MCVRRRCGSSGTFCIPRGGPLLNPPPAPSPPASSDSPWFAVRVLAQMDTSFGMPVGQMWCLRNADKLDALQGRDPEDCALQVVYLCPPTREAHPFLLKCLKEKSIVPKEARLKKIGPNVLPDLAVMSIKNVLQAGRISHCYGLNVSVPPAPNTHTLEP